jgi:drug/metabolite transporter (DMT)-like permease
MPPVTSLQEETSRRRGQSFVALAAVAWSTAGVMQRALSVDAATQLAGRALFASLALAVFVAVSNRGRVIRPFRSLGGAGIAVAASFSIASASFIVALNHAKVANVLFIGAAAPIAAALLARIALAEPVTRRAWAAMIVAVLGVALMVTDRGSGGALGVTVALVMTGAFAVGIVITRHKRDVSMAPAVCLAQILVLLAFAPFAHPGTVTKDDVALFILLGVGQMGLGLVFLTIGARLIPALEVALITLLEIPLAVLWVWLATSEQPSPATLMGGGVVVTAVLFQTTTRRRFTPSTSVFRSG